MFNLPLPDQPQSQGRPPLILISMDWLIDCQVYQHFSREHIEENQIPLHDWTGQIFVDLYGSLQKKLYITYNVYIYI